MGTTVREPRAKKVAVVDDVRARFASAEGAIFTEYRGLAVSDLQVLRRALREVGSEYRIYKNTLVRRAANEAGLSVLEPILEGPTAIAFVSKDISLVAKVLRDFARTNPRLVVKGGLIGTGVLDDRSTNALAELPSRDVLLARIAGVLAAPMQRFAGLLAALPQRFAYGIAALRDLRREEAGPEDIAPAPDAPVQDVAPEHTDIDTPADAVVLEDTEKDPDGAGAEMITAGEAAESKDEAAIKESEGHPIVGSSQSTVSTEQGST